VANQSAPKTPLSPIAGFSTAALAADGIVVEELLRLEGYNTRTKTFKAKPREIRKGEKNGKIRK
jgi:hypothetical protein